MYWMNSIIIRLVQVKPIKWDRWKMRTTGWNKDSSWINSYGQKKKKKKKKKNNLKINDL